MYCSATPSSLGVAAITMPEGVAAITPTGGELCCHSVAVQLISGACLLSGLCSFSRIMAHATQPLCMMES